jgi:hypothetical protein
MDQGTYNIEQDRRSDGPQFHPIEDETVEVCECGAVVGSEACKD